jgi:hypothetical protein
VVVGVVGVVGATAIGCSSTAPIDVGHDPDILWWSDLESGDTSDWTDRGPAYGSLWLLGAGQVSVSPGPARSGRYSMRSTLTATAGAPAGAFVVRQGDLPSDGFYSAWFYVPKNASPATYWVCFKIRALPTNPADPTSAMELWDVELVPFGPPGSPPILELFSHVHGGPQRGVAMPITLGRWFQIEMYFHAAPDTSGRVTLWQDGTQIIDVTQLSTAPTTFLQWSVGSTSDGLSPPTESVYVDDVAVSRRRLGPSFPPFWRP